MKWSVEVLFDPRRGRQAELLHHKVRATEPHSLSHNVSPRLPWLPKAEAGRPHGWAGSPIPEALRSLGFPEAFLLHLSHESL